MKTNVAVTANIIVQTQILTAVTVFAKSMRHWSITQDLLAVGIAKINGKGNSNV